MRCSLFIALFMPLLLAGCSWLPFPGNDSASQPADNKRVSRARPGENFGTLPPDYHLRVVEAFQAKWPNDPIYRYRFELPRRVQVSSPKKTGYAVRFRAQKSSLNTPFPEGFPWIAFFEHGKIVWVLRDSEIGSDLKWFDPAQRTVEWPVENGT
jgi:hypothetical protein